MELAIPDRNFVCIDYPGDVVNTDKAIATLGGLKNLYKTFKDRNVRMKLNFRSDDVYCKPCYGDCVSRVSLVMKVRRKKGTDDIDGEIIGTVDTAYSFTSMCDFQYLAMKRQDDGSYVSHLEESLLTEVQSKEWLAKPAQLFIPPPTYSRFDQPVQYCFRENAAYKNFQFPDNCIGMARSRRPHFTMFFKFTNPTVPCEPHVECIKKLQRMALPSWKIDNVKEKFEHQKIWSTVALYAEVGPAVAREDLKILLPSVAYYCTDGPWRAMWVKLGYDMRTDPSSKIYQNLDTRQEKRMASLLSNKIPAKRSTFNYHLPNTKARNASQPAATSVHEPSSSKRFSNKETDFKTSLEPSYIFRPGVVPNHRQIFYHLYNIIEPEVQKLVHMNDGMETECLEKDGWCLPDTIEKCRAITNSYRYKNSKDIEQISEDADEEIIEHDDDDDDDHDDDVGTDVDFDNDKSCLEIDDDRVNINELEDECGEEEDDEDDEADIFDAQQQSYHNLIDQDNFNEILNLLPNEDGE